MKNSTNWKIGLSYWFVHFSVEVMCFFCIFHLFQNTNYWWVMSLLYDTLAFAPQSIIGAYFEKHPKANPGPFGGILLIVGAAIMLGFGHLFTGPLYIVAEVIGLTFLTMGNCIEHITGAFETLKASEGRLAESAIFVGGGSFGVITGRLLSRDIRFFPIPFVLMLLALFINFIVKSGDNDFTQKPCKQAIAAKKPAMLVVLILCTVVIVRGYIGYGLPTAWNKTTVQTIFLFCFMGLGKMLGGILADIFGPRRVGIFSCLIAVPLLLISNNLMWLSLIAVAFFSMTMAITLGGLVSVLPENPGIAFGITTIGLLLGTLPTFFFPMPGRAVCNILIVILSVLAAYGLYFTLKPDKS